MPSDGSQSQEEWLDGAGERLLVVEHTTYRPADHVGFSEITRRATTSVLATSAFPEPQGSGRVRDQLEPGGAFALSCDDLPDDDFGGLLRVSFAAVVADVVSFPNHYIGSGSARTVYLGLAPPP